MGSSTGYISITPHGNVLFEFNGKHLELWGSCLLKEIKCVKEYEKTSGYIVIDTNYGEEFYCLEESVEFMGLSKDFCIKEDLKAVNTFKVKKKKYVKMFERGTKEHRLLYLEDDMRIMGYLFENLSPSKDAEFFVESFMRSIVRDAMDACNPMLLNMASVNVLERYLETGVKLKELKTPYKYRPNELYWVGSMYAYVSVQKDMSCKQLVELLPFKEMLRLYDTGHQMGYSAFLSHLTL